MSRASGYYWVKMRGADNWIISYYCRLKDWWSICSMRMNFEDNDFSEIGQKIERETDKGAC